MPKEQRLVEVRLLAAAQQNADLSGIRPDQCLATTENLFRLRFVTKRVNYDQVATFAMLAVLPRIHSGYLMSFQHCLVAARKALRESIGLTEERIDEIVGEIGAAVLNSQESHAAPA